MQSQGRSTFPLANLGTPGLMFLAAALFAGVLYVQDYKSHRPEHRPFDWQPGLDASRVASLSTADPLCAAYKCAKQLGFPARSEALDLPTKLRDELCERDLRNEPTLVLIASARGGAWPEDRERRIRTRYAVTSALSHAHFSARTTRELCFVQAAVGGPAIVPYEWFDKSCDERDDSCEFGSVLCLWLDEALLGQEPVKRIHALIAATVPPASKSITTKFIGPSNSGLLLRMLQEAFEMDTAGELGCEISARLEVISPMATVPFELGDPLRQALWLAHCEGANARAMQLARTIGGDDELASALLLELAQRIPSLMALRGEKIEWSVAALERRALGGRAQNELGSSLLLRDSLLMRSLTHALDGVKFLPPRRLPITVALVSEQDTEYGRRWLGTFERTRARLAAQHPLLDEIEFKFVPYSSGIDGFGLDSDGAGSSDTPNADIGASQVDYLKRTERALADERPAAIGVLGTDVYDTLMILQALRRNFRNAVFFTTDMDTRLLAPERLPYTRNVVVASHFDLAVDDQLIRFRDSYQSALYRSLCGVLNGVTRQWRDPASHSRVHLFEIGRGVAVELNVRGLSESVVKPKEGSAPAASWIFNEVEAGELPPQSGAMAGMRDAWTDKVLALCLGLIVILLVVIGHTPGKFVGRTLVQRLVHMLVLVVLPIACFVGLLWAAHSIDQLARRYPAEPLDPFLGVSVWPSILLRGMSTLFCVWSIALLRGRLVKAHERAEREFGLSSDDEPGSLARMCMWMFGIPVGNSRPLLRASIAWTCVRRWLLDWRWLIARLSVYVVVCYGLLAPFFMRSNMASPVRGELGYLIERASVFASVMTFFALVCFVIETSFFTHRLVHRLANPNATLLPEAYLRREAARLGITEKQADQRARILLTQRITATADSMVYFPAVVVGAMVLARADALDNWSWPPVLVGCLVVFFLMLLLCVRNSHLVARTERTRALEFLREERLVHGSDPVRRDRIEQLRVEIEGLRGGAFAPLIEHPLVRSAFLPLAAWASAGLIDHGVLSSLLH